MDTFFNNHTSIEDLMGKKQSILAHRAFLSHELREIEQTEGYSYLKQVRMEELKARILAETAVLKFIQHLELSMGRSNKPNLSLVKPLHP